LNTLTTHVSPPEGSRPDGSRHGVGGPPGGSGDARSRPLAELSDLTGHLTYQLVDRAHQVSERAHHVSERAQEVYAEVKPRLRGWLHAATVPLALAAGIVLVAHSPSGVVRFGSAVFALSALVLFTVSATMHRGHWSPRTNLLLCRLDHASIFLLIAGSYTPFALLLLDGAERTVLLSVAWGGALLGSAFRVLWANAPRWLYTPVYMALGWVSVFFIDDFLASGGPTVVALLGAGGLLYTLGGIVYGLRRPNPIPGWFGFHEVFHGFTIVAFAVHYASVSVATYAVS
jgi:hemolysin III